jgi:fumarylacetoacetate (FAA) hydrolase
MKLGSLKGGPDGRLVVVSRDLSQVADAGHIAPTLQGVLEDWDRLAPPLEALYADLNAGRVADARAFRAEDMAAPLPRAWQWLDGSVFKAHADLATKAFGLASTWNDTPLMYQGMSHQFLGPTDEVAFPDAADGVDFEGEFGIITDAVPMGVSKAQARSHIRLLIQLNDWSLRVIGRDEMARGFGWVRA